MSNDEKKFEDILSLYEASNSIYSVDNKLKLMKEKGLESRKYLHSKWYKSRIIFNGVEYTGVLTAAVIGAIVDKDAFSIYQYLNRKQLFKYDIVVGGMVLRIEVGDDINFKNVNMHEFFDDIIIKSFINK